MGEAPEVGRAQARDAFDDLDVARPGERARKPGSFGDPA
jgi:hypothetical protein